MPVDCTINIITRRQKLGWKGGPGAVVYRTIREFDRIGQRYVINRAIDKYQLIWAHDSVHGLLDAVLRKKKVIWGPNVVPYPWDLPGLRPRLTNTVCLWPSEWYSTLWKECGFDECPIEVWPTGIDVDEFCPAVSVGKERHVFVYFKARHERLLSSALAVLDKEAFTYEVIRYGEYKYPEYRDVLNRCSFGVWLGMQESQGLAMQEALAAGKPLVVWDVQHLCDAVATWLIPIPKQLSDYPKGTSAAWFDQRCGVVIKSEEQLAPALLHVHENLKLMRPREFIEENLTSKKTSQKFLQIVSKHFQIESEGEIVESEEYQPGLLAQLLCRIHNGTQKVQNIFEK